ncbi:hypothetical protein MBLNU459_g1146t1 [Dothideomycetes sp. NU459]
MLFQPLALLTSTLPFLTEAVHIKQRHAVCTSENTLVRKEWGSMSKSARVAYTDAVTCLQSLPSQLDSATYPGAKSRYDDFMAIHINMTSRIHLNGYFLSWHRGFVRLYELALQNECGYNGSQPYWNWPLWASDLSGSPLFDGSAYSLGSDGAKVANESDVVVGPGVTLPHGSGGGCVHSGPFVNYTVPFRSFQFAEALTGEPPVDAFEYTPRCLSRDLNSYIATRYTNATDVATLLAAKNISNFQGILSGAPATYNLGTHGGGHFSMGNQGADFFASPGDPAFYLHHAQIDRLWTKWQAQDILVRPFELSGTQTVLDIPPSANVTFNDTLSWSVAGPNKKVCELAVVGSSPFLCYKYE